MSSLKNFSKNAARKYLQTAVFVDDRIFEKSSGLAFEQLDLPQGRKPIYQKDDAKIVGSGEVKAVSESDTDVSFHPKELVSRFAQEGIICALYEPPNEFDTDADSEIFVLCERADITILDWDLSGDQGEKVLKLITNLVKRSQDDYPHHTRLLTVYTSDNSLIAVANKIADKLRREGYSAEPHSAQCRLHSGATRIVVFGKSLPRFGEEENEFTVKDSNLASRIVDEFTALNEGVLPAYALLGMASIRKNSKRILDRFSSKMDGAFLFHRSLVLDSEDAFDQLPELLCDELLAVMQDSHVGITGMKECGDDLASNLPVGAPQKPWTDSNGKPIDHVSIVRNILKEGRSGLTSDDRKCSQANSIHKDGWRKVSDSVIRDLQLMVGNGTSEPNLRLAALYSTRTHYNNSFRNLTYGSIIREKLGTSSGDSWIYGFCMMPICDSIRLHFLSSVKRGQPVKFPFWRLSVATSSGGGTQRGIVIELSDGTLVELYAGGKAREMLYSHEFFPDTQSGKVKATRNSGMKYVCTSFKKDEIEWVGELKPLHAQRIAHDIGLGLSRVGVLEAEWIRLLSDK